MTVKGRQQENSAATRAALLKVARKLFAERGYADTATEEVVRRARVTRGALYHHFGGKQDLFEAVLHEEQARLSIAVAKAAASKPDALSQLIAGCEAFLDECMEPAMQQIVLIDAPAVLGWAKWRETDASYYLEGTKAQLQAAIDAGLVPKQPVTPLAHVLMGALNEAAMLIANAEDKPAARREITAVVDRLFASIRTPGGT